ncbi:MAG: hypothetical protein K0Q79_2312 [Flavipsychrobacter sp.]|jgi:hypothetical protein|nr:hypothetical protein [Flavipsychrobacter sp.]
MFFTRTHTYHFPVPKDDLKNRLIGRHVKIHDLDFEIMDRDEKLTIIPHAEQISDIKTLPITSVEMNEAGGKTKVKVTSRMRALDSGGPILIVIFCAFMLVASMVMYFIGEPLVCYTLLGISAGIFTIFWIRLETGYFDYVRKVHAFVKEKANPSLAEAGMPVARA